MGDSGTGKTACFSFIKECMAVNPQILCLNYLDYQKDVKEIIRHTKGKLIVIDNADILLDDDTRKYISLDDKNQYLIIGRNPKNLFATKENASILDDTNIVIRNTDGKDYKWKLSEQEAGTYTITINFNTNKISFEKQN